MFAISAALIFLALQSAQNSVSDFQPKQPIYFLRLQKFQRHFRQPQNTPVPEMFYRLW
jgi:hypothetical protein